MKIIPCYKNSIINLPGETVLPRLSTASREELAVLIAVTSAPEFDVSALAMKLNITEATLLQAISTWTRCGAISVAESKETARTEAEESVPTEREADGGKTPNVTRVTALRSTTLPHYSTEETARYLEENPSFASLLDSCQMILGKVFNTAEATIIIGMADHLSLSHEYIMLLFAHAKNMGKDSVRYIEKMALSLFDKGVLTYAELIEEVGAREAAMSMESFVRKLFGLGRRALIESEKVMIDRWTNEYKMDRDMIRRAYEITVAKTTEPSFPYMNAVIENWHKAGYSTIEQVTAAEEAYRRDKEAKAEHTGSFDTDEFFEAALKRSFEGLVK
ncbi:MAG: DnaD domain protein [Ruminococcaceae bacterium]|nr:DnaD domain protein [Oscillospiraceae bacterium]